MQLKKGVTVEGTQPQIYYAIGVAEGLWRVLAGAVLVVTSLTDSHTNRPQSKHNKGMGVDFRTRNLKGKDVQRVFAALKDILDPLGYDVVLEPDHIHCEYDPKGKENWVEVVS